MFDDDVMRAGPVPPPLPIGVVWDDAVDGDEQEESMLWFVDLLLAPDPRLADGAAAAVLLASVRVSRSVSIATSVSWTSDVKGLNRLLPPSVSW